MDAVLKDAATECGNVLKSLVTNTIKLSIQKQLVPIIKDALMSAMEDAKDEAKGGDAKEGEVEIKDRLVFDPNEKEPDMFLLHLVDTLTQGVWFGNPYTAYKIYSIRIGSDPKKGGRFFCRGLENTLRWNHLQSLHNKIREEYKEVKEPAFPVLPPQQLHGYYCLCLTRAGTVAGHDQQTRAYLKALTSKTWQVNKEGKLSQTGPDFFALGDEWEKQQRNREIMKEAGLAAAEEFLGRKPWWRDFRDPFDESDVLRQLLSLVMDYKIIPRLRSAVSAPVCRSQAMRAAEELVVNAVNTSAGSWSGMQDALNKGRDELLKLLEEQAGKIADALKPIFKTVMAKLNEKNKPKEVKEPAKDEGAKLGDFIANWQFGATEVGKKLAGALESEGSALAALRGLQQDLNPRNIIENKLKDFAASLANGGYSFMAHPVVAYIIEDLAREIGYTLNRFNTVDAILKEGEPFFKSVDAGYNTLKELAGKSGDDVTKGIEAVSAGVWKGIADSGVDLFHAYKYIRRDYASKLQGQKVPEPAEEAVLGMLDDLFTMHMQALNACRVTFLKGLREGLTGDALANADSILRVARSAFQRAVTQNIQICAEEQWTKTAVVLTIYAKHVAYDKFMETAWPAIQECLEAVNGILPEQIAKMGIPEKILKKVLEIVIFKAIEFAFKKLIPLVEKYLFTQG